MGDKLKIWRQHYNLDGYKPTKKEIGIHGKARKMVDSILRLYEGVGLYAEITVRTTPIDQTRLPKDALP